MHHLISKIFYLFLLFLLILSVDSVFAQVVPQGNDSAKVLHRREANGLILVHSQGWGFGYKQGKHLTGYKKLMFESEFVWMKHPKEKKTLYPIDENAKSYFYGKLNSLYLLRVGTGIQSVLNSKPYWGGVEVRYLYLLGVSLGITKPVFLYIWNYSTASNQIEITTERYDPQKHDIDNIYGNAPFYLGLGHISFHPGLYGKFAFNFEFSESEKNIRYLEAGITGDFFAKPIQIMAFNNKNQFFVTLYLSFGFGKRKL